MLDKSLTTKARRRNAEEIAVAGLEFLAADEERLSGFLALSGIAPQEIRTAAARPDFLAGVLAHIMDDERLASAFALEQSLSPEGLARAAHALGAGLWERDLP